VPCIATIPSPEGICTQRMQASGMNITHYSLAQLLAAFVGDFPFVPFQATFCTTLDVCDTYAWQTLPCLYSWPKRPTIIPLKKDIALCAVLERVKAIILGNYSALPFSPSSALYTAMGWSSM
jgi:hypothetical protein